MKIELTRNADNKIVGYKMIKESDEDTATIEIIRDMYFWSIDDQVLTYDGRHSDEKDNTIELKFVRKWYAEEKSKEYKQEIIKYRATLQQDEERYNTKHLK